jgi:hypothetical protein
MVGQVLVAGALVTVAACGGGGGGTPTGPGNTGGGSPGPSGATITIANGRVTPSAVTITVGQSVTFVNNDGRVHNVSSDPHPVHTDCPQINAVGNLSNNQTRLTNAFPAARSCGFHDHDDPDNGALKGRITIQ